MLMGAWPSMLTLTETCAPGTEENAQPEIVPMPLTVWFGAGFSSVSVTSAQLVRASGRTKPMNRRKERHRCFITFLLMRRAAAPTGAPPTPVLSRRRTEPDHTDPLRVGGEQQLRFIKHQGLPGLQRENGGPDLAHDGDGVRPDRRHIEA